MTDIEPIIAKWERRMKEAERKADEEKERGNAVIWGMLSAKRDVYEEFVNDLRSLRKGSTDEETDE
jgi:hypothetical protein